MTVSARKLDDTFRIVGDWGDAASANAFLGHLDARAFSPSTVRSYAFDIVNFARFLLARGSTLVEVSPMMGVPTPSIWETSTCPTLLVALASPAHQA